MMDITATIKGIEYKPFLCKKLDEVDINGLESAF